MKQNKNKSSYAKQYASFMAFMLFAFFSMFAHDDHDHEPPDQLPPVGPLGGSYALMKNHYAEVVVGDNSVHVYILEPDLSEVADDAENITVDYMIPRRSDWVSLDLQKDGEGYRAAVQIPATARRVLFRITFLIDGGVEAGIVQYERNP